MKIRKRMSSILILMIIGSVVLSGCGNKFSDEGFKNTVFTECDNLELIKELIEDEGYSPNSMLFNNSLGKEASLLYNIQVQDYKPRFAEYLLESGADPDIAYDDKSMLMALASPEFGAGGIGYASLLLDKGADINLKDNDGKTALDHAIENDDSEFAIFLLQNGAKVSKNTMELLDGNSEFGSIRYFLTKLLYDNAEKQNIKIELENPILGAIYSGNTNAVIDYINNGDIDVESDLPFHIIAHCGQGALQCLIDNDFDVSQKNSHGRDILWIAAGAGNLDVVKFIMENSIIDDFPEYNAEVGDPINSAVANNDYAMVEYLLKSGLGFSIDSETGYDNIKGDSMDNDGVVPATCIEWAVENSNTKMLNLLKNNNYPFNEDTYYLALRMAIMNDNYEIISYILENDVDLNHIPKYISENSLLEICGTSGTGESAKLLVEKDRRIISNNSDALVNAVEAGNYEVGDYLLKNGMAVNASKSYDKRKGMTPWEVAPDNGYLDMIELLIANGADVNNDIIVFIASPAITSNRILNCLIENGADVNNQDSDGYTALMMSAGYNRVQNIKDLLKAGADVGLKDSEGKTALDYAKDIKAEEIIKLFEDAE